MSMWTLIATYSERRRLLAGWSDLQSLTTAALRRREDSSEHPGLLRGLGQPAFDWHFP